MLDGLKRRDAGAAADAAGKRLSQLEAVELITISRREPNRFIKIRYEHLKRRGLLDANGDLTPAAHAALRAWGYTP